MEADGKVLRGRYKAHSTRDDLHERVHEGVHGRGLLRGLGAQHHGPHSQAVQVLPRVYVAHALLGLAHNGSAQVQRQLSNVHKAVLVGRVGIEAEEVHEAVDHEVEGRQRVLAHKLGVANKRQVGVLCWEGREREGEMCWTYSSSSTKSSLTFKQLPMNGKGMATASWRRRRKAISLTPW